MCFILYLFVHGHEELNGEIVIRDEEFNKKCMLSHCSFYFNLLKLADFCQDIVNVEDEERK